MQPKLKPGDKIIWNGLPGVIKALALSRTGDFVIELDGGRVITVYANELTHRSAA